MTGHKILIYMSLAQWLTAGFKQEKFSTQDKCFGAIVLALLAIATKP